MLDCHGIPFYISEFSLEGSNKRITCDITLPYALSDISQFINHYETLVPYKPGNKVDMDDFLIKAETQKIKIADALQKVQDSPNLIFTTGQGHMQGLPNLLKTPTNT